MSVAGVQAAEAVAAAEKEKTANVAPLLFGGSWFQAPGSYSTKNCVVIACKSCGSETYVLKRHYATGYTCPACVQANSYA